MMKCSLPPKLMDFLISTLVEFFVGVLKSHPMYDKTWGFGVVFSLLYE